MTRILAGLCIALLATPVMAQTAGQLAGRWGIAAYWNAKDAQKARGWARAACGSPYTIGRTADGNLSMHIADDPKPHELELVAGGGRTVLEPVGDVPGGTARHSRELSGFDGSSFELRWLDPGVARRYGVNVYVRCGR
jgi:hypothetical protein